MTQLLIQQEQIFASILFIFKLKKKNKPTYHKYDFRSAILSNFKY